MGQIAAEVKIEDVSQVKKKLSLEIPWAEVKTALDSAYAVIGKKAKVKGFRPGKTPRKVLEMHYKKEAEEEAISNLITESYTKALESNSLSPVSQPEIDQEGIETEKDFAYTATFEVEPVFEPKDYTGIEVEKEEHEVTDSDVEERINQIREMYSTLEGTEEDRGVVENDFVTIDFQGTIDGESRDDMKSENYLLQIGSNMFIPGFEVQLIGAKKGETKEITVTFPDDYTATELAGKEAIFSVSVKDIRVKKLPELDENFIKNIEAFETLDDLRKDIRQTLETENETGIKNNLRNNMITKLLENNDFEVPSTFVNRQIYYMMMDAERRMISNGMPKEKAAQISANLHERFEGDATRMVKTSLLLGKIGDKESITVEDEDLEKRLKELAERYGQDYESLKTTYENNNLTDRLKDEILEQKILDFIEDKAIIKVVPKKTDKETGEE